VTAGVTARRVHASGTATQAGSESLAQCQWSVTVTVTVNSTRAPARLSLGSADSESVALGRHGPVTVLLRFRVGHSGFELNSATCRQ
jgi:hypothetical protein